jgi:uncharacterized protein (DUF697 family)
MRDLICITKQLCCIVNLKIFPLIIAYVEGNNYAVLVSCGSIKVSLYVAGGTEMAKEEAATQSYLEEVSEAQREAVEASKEANKKRDAAAATLKKEIASMEEHRKQRLAELEKLTGATTEAKSLFNAAQAPAAGAQVVAATIKTIVPNSTTAGGADVPVLLTGSGFDITSTLLWNGSAINAQVTVTPDGMTLSTAIPASAVTTPGTFQIAVQNAGGHPSNSVPFTVSVDALTAQAQAVVDKYSRYAAGVGLLPGTLLNFAGVFAAQYLMVGELGTVYGQNMSSERLVTAVAGAVGASVDIGLGQIVRAIAGSMVPFSLSFGIGIVVDPATAYASTQAVGRFFMSQFQSAANQKTIQTASQNFMHTAMLMQRMLQQRPSAAA